MVPMKVKLRHMEKTIFGLFLATAANIDRDLSQGQVRGLNPDRVQARYDDLLRAPPPECIDDLLLVPGVRMFCLVLFRFYSIFSAI